MKIIKDWLKKRQEKKEAEIKRINESLQKAGYFCPNTYDFHNRGELSEWTNGVRYWTCKKCGNTEGAMAIVNPFN